MKLALVAGARPNFMKVAPLVHAIARHNNRCAGENGVFDPVLMHTGQHDDIMMSEIFFRELNIPDPDVNLMIDTLVANLSKARARRTYERLGLEP